MMSQVSYANYISPFGAMQPVQESTVAGNVAMPEGVSGGATGGEVFGPGYAGIGVTGTETTENHVNSVPEGLGADVNYETAAPEVGVQFGPGMSGVQQSPENIQPGSTAVYPGSEFTQPVQEPGAMTQEESGVVRPSASYSTKEPVLISTPNTAGGPGSTSASGVGSQILSPQMQMPHSQETVQAPTQGLMQTVAPGQIPTQTQTPTQTPTQTSTPTQTPTQTPIQAPVQTQGPMQVAAQTQGPGVTNQTDTGTSVETKKAEIEEPVIAAESAILYDVTHDRVLYEKNADTKRYPASITKILTALLVLENAGMNEIVTYSENAVTRLESGAVTLQLQAGDRVSVKDSLYGLMLKSANEVANGLAEHVGGTLYGFADMMNAKAAELGCTNSHFVNPNGLNNADHYTTARDMAKIAKAAFANETLCEITSTTSYKFPETKAAKARTVSMGHKMIYENDSRYYEGIVGGKTGYTSLAGNTLVTCVERDGVRMIAVILKSRSTHYSDTKALFDYGYELEKAGAMTPVQQNSVTTGQPTVQTGMTSAEPKTAFHKWVKDGENWRFELADGTRLSDCFVTIDGAEYAFDSEGKMVNEWFALGQNWHYFGSSGAMVKSDWRKDGDYWFYLGADGAMMRNTWIDQQYYVGADGVWVES